MHLQEVKRDFGRRKPKEKRNRFEEEIELVEFLNSKISRVLFDDRQLQEYILGLTVPLVSRKGVTFDTIESIPSYKPEEVSVIPHRPGLYSLEEPKQIVEEYRQVVEVASNFLKDFAKENKLMTICFIPPYVSIEKYREAVNSHLSDSGTRCKFETLSTYLTKIARKISTPLDKALPRECHFAKLPSLFRSCVIEVQSFSMKSPPEEGFTKEEELGLFDSKMGVLLVFRDMPKLFARLKEESWFVTLVGTLNTPEEKACGRRILDRC